jgi:hypothetical protein
VAFAVDLASDQNRTVAINAAGLDSFTVTVPGTGTGDLDWGMVAPTVSGWSPVIASATGYICFGNVTSGNPGSCSRTKANIISGWYLVNLYAWTNGTSYTVPVNGESITLTAYPTP